VPRGWVTEGSHVIPPGPKTRRGELVYRISYKIDIEMQVKKVDKLFENT
jgi:hypothetical protein